MAATTFEELWQELEQGAKDVYSEVKGDLVAAEGVVVPVLEEMFVAFWSQYKDLALRTVANLMGAAGASLTGTEKFGQAVTTVFQKAEVDGAAIGVQAAVQDAQALVQLAYRATQQARGIITPAA